MSRQLLLKLNANKIIVLMNLVRYILLHKMSYNILDKTHPIT